MITQQIIEQRNTSQVLSDQVSERGRVCIGIHTGIRTRAQTCIRMKTISDIRIQERTRVRTEVRTY